MNDKEALTEFARGLQLLCEKLANDLTPKTEATPSPVESKLEKAMGHTAPVPIESFDPFKILWEPRDGNKGQFELASAKNNNDKIEYAKMVHLLKPVGSLTKEGMYYWLFTNGDAVGRKPVRK